jgi:hypothetical protein
MEAPTWRPPSGGRRRSGTARRRRRPGATFRQFAPSNARRRPSRWGVMAVACASLRKLVRELGVWAAGTDTRLAPIPTARVGLPGGRQTPPEKANGPPRRTKRPILGPRSSRGREGSNPRGPVQAYASRVALFRRASNPKKAATVPIGTAAYASVAPREDRRNRRWSSRLGEEAER